MRGLLGSTRARLLSAAAASALGALFLLLVNPFPTDVLGQTGGGGAVTQGDQVVVNGVTVVNGSDQPANVQPDGNAFVIAVPEGFTVMVQGATCTPVGGSTNVVRCTAAPGSRVTFTSVAGVQRQPTAAPGGAPAPAVAPVARPAAPAQQPAALPRTGTGSNGDGMTGTMLTALALLGLAVAFGSGALVLSVRRARG
jgi:hypothetical protein